MPPSPSRLSSILRLWGMIWFSICRRSLSVLPPIFTTNYHSATVHWEAMTEAVRRDGLTALGRPQQIRDTASAKLLTGGFVAYEDTTVVPSLVKAASGMVLELGPGPGNIFIVYGIEPNPHFKDVINAKLAKHNLQDRYKLIICGVEDSDILRKEGITEGSLDTVLCIQVLCAVKDPKNVMKEVWKLLKPGGKFIFWEHGWSRNHLTAVAQACFNPAWSTFVGCNLIRNILADILNSGEWENPHEIKEPGEPFSLMPRIQGVLVKKKF
ncbi:hypothetical protein N7508_003691 [Penicillium antarcticum]|uniref:uncharacterized protein n=1 Tax=Penicillium antarcticum TaxID=416450 RepID=UPI00238677E0|nr:uncharacterized protein N7508_003691 [Penicillium antarcticum]KAJ5312861.1 hypothetical protein N7508_003691 [Penicillium antarcticum]